jgi:hypothetical protein
MVAARELGIGTKDLISEISGRIPLASEAWRILRPLICEAACQLTASGMLPGARRLGFRPFSHTQKAWRNPMCKSRLNEKSRAVATTANTLARAACPLLGLVLCTHATLAQQGAQQAPPRVGVLGVPAEKAAPPQVPSGSRPPDHVFPAINSWILGALAFSADGQWLASGRYGDTVIVWNVATGAEQSILSWPQPPNNAVVKLAFSPDGTHLTEMRYNGRVTIWDFEKATVVSSTKLRSGAGIQFAYSPDGKHIGNERDGTRRLNGSHRDP